MGYVCTRCQREYPEFRLRCSECGAYRTLEQGGSRWRRSRTPPVALPFVSVDQWVRLGSGIQAFDDLLGGGLVPGSSLLISGEPGAGKSTLLLQLLDASHLPALYVSGEESVQQVKLRAERLKINSPQIALLFETNVAHLLGYVDHNGARLLVIDSIQTVYSDISDCLPGSPTQIRKCVYLLRRTAQEKQLVLLIVGQITKDKQAAGPKLLEHAVDVVLSLTADEAAPQRRILSVSKNRFGPAGRAWPFSMTAEGFTSTEPGR
ncbi:MAG TPA: ATPase domain-containing protein [Bacteroidota bacterium]|nr:ATPase domain-containing protein [Bacteroidota bacterium]